MVSNLDIPEGTEWLKVDAANGISGFELFGTRNGNQLAGYTGVNIATKCGIFPKIEKGARSDIAFVNVEEEEAVVALTAYDDHGFPLATETKILPPHEKQALSVENIFTDPIEEATYVRYISDRVLVGFQLNGSFDQMMLDGLPGMRCPEDTGEVPPDVPPPPGAPTVLIEDPVYGSVFDQGATVAFNGAAQDAEGNALSGEALTWHSSIDGFLGVGALPFSRADLSPGVHTITLTATDGEGLTNKAKVTITINGSAYGNSPPVVSIVTPVSGSSYLLGQPVAFEASCYDPEDGIIIGNSLIWGGSPLNWYSSLDGLLETDNAFTLYGLSEGTHTITLTATDSEGFTSSASVTIVVGTGGGDPPPNPGGGNAPPVVTMVSPENGERYAVGELITFSASCYDPEDGPIIGNSVIWGESPLSWHSSIDGLLETDNSFGLRHLSSGTHLITLTATDSEGLTASATVTIVVGSGG
jgi:hypothetical protein